MLHDSAELIGCRSMGSWMYADLCASLVSVYEEVYLATPALVKPVHGQWLLQYQHREILLRPMPQQKTELLPACKTADSGQTGEMRHACSAVSAGKSCCSLAGPEGWRVSKGPKNCLKILGLTATPTLGSMLCSRAASPAGRRPLLRVAVLRRTCCAVSIVGLGFVCKFANISSPKLKWQNIGIHCPHQARRRSLGLILRRC